MPIYPFSNMYSLNFLGKETIISLVLGIGINNFFNFSSKVNVS